MYNTAPFRLRAPSIITSPVGCWLVDGTSRWPTHSNSVNLVDMLRCATSFEIASLTQEDEKSLRSSTRTRCLRSINFLLQAPLGTHFVSDFTTNTPTCTVLTLAAFLRFCSFENTHSSRGSKVEPTRFVGADEEEGKRSLIALALAPDGLLKPVDISVARLVNTFWSSEFFT